MPNASQSRRGETIPDELHDSQYRSNTDQNNLNQCSTTRKIMREDRDVVLNGVLSMLIDHDLVEETAVPVIPPFLGIAMEHPLGYGLRVKYNLSC
jgi:hypothetical protein